MTALPRISTLHERFYNVFNAYRSNSTGSVKVPIPKRDESVESRQLARHPIHYVSLHKALINGFGCIADFPHTFEVFKGRAKQVWQLVKRTESDQGSEFALIHNKQPAETIPPSPLDRHVDGTTIFSALTKDKIVVSLLEKLAHIGTIQESEIHLKKSDSKKDAETAGIVMTWEVLALFIDTLKAKDFEKFAEILKDTYEGRVRTRFPNIPNRLGKNAIRFSLRTF